MQYMTGGEVNAKTLKGKMDELSAKGCKNYGSVPMCFLNCVEESELLEINSGKRRYQRVFAIAGEFIERYGQ
jgi:hypothetical protein